MVNDAYISFENMREERKFELAQPFTLTLTFDPIVLLPKAKPLTVMKNADDALIPPPEM